MHAHPSNLPVRPANRRIRRIGPPKLDYERSRDLPRLIPLWPIPCDDDGENASLYVIARLRAALRAERRRGRAGHWTYDLARHAALVQAYKAEMKRLRSAPAPDAQASATALDAS